VVEEWVMVEELTLEMSMHLAEVGAIIIIKTQEQLVVGQKEQQEAEAAAITARDMQQLLVQYKQLLQG
jgi:hypothetical protein